MVSSVDILPMAWDAPALHLEHMQHGLIFVSDIAISDPVLITIGNETTATGSVMMSLVDHPETVLSSEKAAAANKSHEKCFLCHEDDNRPLS